jgi:hypothetical protein
MMNQVDKPASDFAQGSETLWCTQEPHFSQRDAETLVCSDHFDTQHTFCHAANACITPISDQ